MHAPAMVDLVAIEQWIETEIERLLCKCINCRWMYGEVGMCYSWTYKEEYFSQPTPPHSPTPLHGRCHQYPPTKLHFSPSQSYSTDGSFTTPIRRRPWQHCRSHSIKWTFTTSHSCMTTGLPKYSPNKTSCTTTCHRTSQNTHHKHIYIHG